MLTLPTIINTRSTATVRHPVIGFQLGFSTPIRISNHDVVFNGLSFVKAGLKCSNFKTTEAGIQSGRIEFINDDYTYTQIAFNEILKAITAIGYIWYGDGPFTTGDEIQFFKGEIVKPVKVHDTIIYEVATVAAAARKIPDLTPMAPDINYMPYPGQRYRWEDQPYEVLY